jgi:hypothetical protein
LQTLTIHTRGICTRAEEINYFIFNRIDNYPLVYLKNQDNDLQAQGDHRLLPLCDIQLPGNLGHYPAGIPNEVERQTVNYQQVRFFAMGVLNLTNQIYGSVMASLLPIMYALLGACAAVLRTFTQQVENKVFISSYVSPRFFIAGIAGGVIGLFNLSMANGLTASPLAFAFLVGYGTDVFFSFLDRSLPGAKVDPR